MRRGALSTLGALTIACALLTAAASAGAVQWEVTQLTEQPRLFGMSCPNPSLCVATGTSGALVSSSDPTGGPAAWSFVYPDPETTEPAGSGVYNGSQIRGVSCPTSSVCVAAGLTGFLYSTSNPTGPASAWNVVDVSPKGPNTHMYGISCPSPLLCVAVAFGGRIVTSTNPTAQNAAVWDTAQLAEPLQLSGVSCPSAQLCVAVSRDGAIVTSTDPSGGGGAWKVVSQPGLGMLFGVACPSPTLCVTANDHDFFVSTEPRGEASAWADQPGVTPLQVTAVSCASAEACAAVNNNSDVFTSPAPTAGPQSWSFVNAIPYTAANGVFGISCPTRSFCAMAAAQGRVSISTDPFGDEAVPAEPAHGKHRRRPTVKLTRHPRARVMTGKPRARVRFRFRELGVLKGFLCQLDAAKFSRCHSPKAYLVGPGRHTFRVKAFDPGGFDQTVTRFRFRVLSTAAG